jgi:DNA-binding cell septation regulator SpoVG
MTSPSEASEKKPTVHIDKFYIPPSGDNPRMVVDLDFLNTDGSIICQVCGFKLMGRSNGGFWLSVPQRQHKDGVWTDIFSWGSRDQAEEARKMIHAAYDAEMAQKGDF